MFVWWEKVYKELVPVQQLVIIDYDFNWVFKILGCLHHHHQQSLTL